MNGLTLSSAPIATMATLSMIAFTSTASAQGESAGDGGLLEEIIVTAQKREQSINTVPSSITAVTGERLAELGVVDTAALSKVVPGFVVANTYFGSPVYYLRGVGFYDTALAAKPAVSLYADEVPIPFAIMGLGTALDLERVEVLKGPQGTFFGSNATGGAINFIAAKPTADFAWGTDLSFGRFDDVQAGGFVSGPLTDTLLTRFAVSTRHASDWQRGYNSATTNGSVDITSARWKLDWEPAAAPLKVGLTLSGTQDRSEVQAPQIIGKVPMTLVSPLFTAYPLAPLNDARAADVSNAFPYSSSPRRDDWTWSSSLRADYEATPNLTLTSLTSYSRAKRENAYEGDGTALAVTDLYLAGNVRTFTQEIRAAFSVDDRVTGVVGMNYEDDDSDEDVTFLLPEGRNGRIFIPLGLPAIDLVPQIAAQQSESYAGFANAEVKLSDTWRASAGVRYTETKTDFQGCAQAGGNLAYSIGITTILGVPLVPSGECATFTQLPGGGYAAGLVSNSIDEDNVSWRASLDWTARAGTMLYGTVSRGYKGGSFSNISAVFASQYTPVPQEELTAYELGVKSEVIPNRLHVNAAAFYYDYVDKQLLGTVQVPVFIALTALVSIPESSVRGAEFDLTFNPIENFSMYVAGTYVETEIKGHPMLNTVFGTVADFGGAEFPNTPKWQANAGAEYSWSLGSDRQLFVGTQVTYRDQSYSDFIEDPRLEVDSYSLWDAQLGVRGNQGRWQVQLWGRNLSDEVYATTIVRRQEALVRTTGMPRTYGISFMYRP